MLSSGSVERTPDAVAHTERPSDFTTLPEGEQESVIVFDSPTFLTLPDESTSVKVSEMRYARCRQTFIKPRAENNGLLPPGVGLDIFLQQKMLTSYVLVDSSGRITQQMPRSQLALGFDTTLQSGKFYEDPTLGFFYYLERIEGNMCYWIAIETIQHGKLLQIQYTQLKEYAMNMVEVVDPETLERLERRLDRFQRN